MSGGDRCELLSNAFFHDSSCSFSLRIRYQLHIKSCEICFSILTTVGGQNGEANLATFYVKLVPYSKRKATTTVMKERVRKQLAPIAAAHPKVKDYDVTGGGALRPFTL